MSLATLKRKTAAKYNNSSVNTPAFSLNGIYRSQGYVGQSSMGRSLSRALSTYDGTPRGYCASSEPILLLQSGISQNEESKSVKPSVLSQQDVLIRRKGCYNGAGGEINTDGLVLFSGSGCNVSKNQKQNNNNSAGDYIEYYRQKTILCIPIDHTVPCVNVKENKEIKVAISQGDYLLTLKSQCAPLTKQGMYFNNSHGTGVVCSTTGTKGI